MKNKKEEIWKQVTGFEGRYLVSNLGIIKSLDVYVNHSKGGLALKKGRVLKASKDRDGYEFVTLCREDGHYNFMVHRIVAQEFCKNKKNASHVNHKNSIRDDNRSDNLEWVSAKENVIHSIKHGNRNYKKRIYQYDMDGLLINEYEYIEDVINRTGSSRNSIYRRCRGQYDHIPYLNSFWSYNKYDNYFDR